MKIVRKIALGICIVLAMSTMAFAYLDPSVMTYVIQVGATIVVAAGVTAGIIWHKIRKKVNKTFNIDENAHKEIEDKLEVIDEEDSETNKEDTNKE